MFGFFRSGPSVDVAALMPRIAAGEVTLVDVRDPMELSMSGKARGAVNIPLGRVATECDPRHPEFNAKLSLERPVAVYCASGARSGQAKSFLERMGFGEVINLGGLHDWAAAGGAVER